ncbi:MULTISPECIES: hypothetical protein [Streptomyces]|uniref:Uncharacterized protein n=1 Tax=Streptomyces dengpaensis TaxID=2049881 RepID=A0ABM6T4J6_9ACTN|nr:MULTISPECIES: hypothetical protein [Streptomyces]AVH61576.1 hypothetical protein C4B68_34370 [Streptomyces dengpaensis]
MNQPTEPEPAVQAADKPDPIPQLCCHCGELTREPVLVGEVHTASGAGSSIFACPKDAPLFGEHTVRLQGRAS